MAIDRIWQIASDEGLWAPSQVLLAVAAAMPADATLIRHYRKIAGALGGFERVQAERVLDRFDT